jgi:hypothetical protein
MRELLVRPASAALLLVTLLPQAGRAEPEDDPAATEAELRRITQQMMDAVAPGESAVWERYLDERVVYLDENGVVHDRASLLRDLTPLPPGLVGSIEVDKFRVTLQGEVAVVAAELQERLDYHGQPLATRFRHLDTWLRGPSGWRLAARHVAAVLSDPPAVTLPEQELCAYAGEYRLTPAIRTTLRCEEGALVAVREGRPPATYRPELRDVFYVAGQPRSRRIFQRDAEGALTGFVDRREGVDVRWTRVVAAVP